MIRWIALLLVAAMAVALSSSAMAEDKEKSQAADALRFKMKSLGGKNVDLAKKYQDKVVLVVNTASECGLTPHYEGLQALHEKYGKDGLAVVGFPCNQFGKQEPGDAKQIRKFCTKNYGVTFDMFAKVEVNGKGQCELYKFLTSKETNPKFAGPIEWNFAKFLIDRDGNVVARFHPRVEPESDPIVKAIEGALGKE